MKNRDIVENVWKILLEDGSQKWEVSGQNGGGGGVWNLCIINFLMMTF